MNHPTGRSSCRFKRSEATLEMLRGHEGGKRRAILVNLRLLWTLVPLVTLSGLSSQALAAQLQQQWTFSVVGTIIGDNDQPTPVSRSQSVTVTSSDNITGAFTLPLVAPPGTPNCQRGFNATVTGTMRDVLTITSVTGTDCDGLPLSTPSLPGLPLSPNFPATTGFITPVITAPDYSLTVSGNCNIGCGPPTITIVTPQNGQTNAQAGATLPEFVVTITDGVGGA